MSFFDKKTIAKNFSQAAHSYDLWAEAHRLLAKELIRLLPSQLNSAVDLGCGTGIVMRELLQHYPDLRLHAIDIAEGMLQFCQQQWPISNNITFSLEDIDSCHLPFIPDVIISNCVFQWLPDLPQTLSHLKQHMANRTLLAFSELSSGSTPELNEARRQVGLPPALLQYRSHDDILSALQTTDFQVLSQTATQVKVIYPNAFQALKSFKGIGATFTGLDGNTPLSKGNLLRLCRCYQDLFSQENGIVPVTYQVSIITATKNPQ